MQDLAQINCAISPCPNDIYLFSGFLLKAIPFLDADNISILEIRDLNHYTAKGYYDLAKVSMAQYLKLQETYKILNIGGAFAKSNGPKLVKQRSCSKTFDQSIVAIPGGTTTSGLLLQRFFPHLKIIELPFFDIIPALKKGICHMGLVINESKTVLKQHSLCEVLDLAELWYEETSTFLPLGCLVLNKKITEKSSNIVTYNIERSLNFARSNRDLVLSLLQRFSQEKKEQTIWSHIDQFVDQPISNEEKNQAIRVLRHFLNKSLF